MKSQEKEGEGLPVYRNKTLSKIIAHLLGGIFIIAVSTVIGAWPSPGLAAPNQPTGPSGLPLPRYVSLKSERVNMRIGPGRAYQVQWLYLKRGLPMEVIQEYGNWRKVRDPEGNEGWILHSLLSGDRTAIVAPWSQRGGAIDMRHDPLPHAPLAARLEPGVVASVRECKGAWCQVATGGVKGYVDRKLLWGVYPDEDF